MSTKHELVTLTRYRRDKAVENIKAVFYLSDGRTIADGLTWYRRVNEAAARDARGTSTNLEGAAGIVAAVSPSMDWEGNNMHAVRELHTLTSADWREIAAGDRSPVRGMSMSSATTKNLLKAHRILAGESPALVLDIRTAPKTHSFFRNIFDPSTGEFVTIDGRAHDIAVNRMVQWRTDRGISSASNVRGTQTRYEFLAECYIRAARELGILPHQLQAITWEQGKRIEKSGLTKSGKPRRNGQMRVGQPYIKEVA